MSRALRTCMPTIKNVARAYTTMLTFLVPSIFTVIIEYVPGIDNDGTNTLSLPSQFPTWLSASAICPGLSPLMAHRIPIGLSLYLHWLGSAP